MFPFLHACYGRFHALNGSGCHACCRCGNRFGLFSLLLHVFIPTVVVLQIFEGVMNLLDRLKAWHSSPGSPGNVELKEMAQIGLRIITGYIKQRSPVSFTHQTHTQTINIKYC